MLHQSELEPIYYVGAKIPTKQSVIELLQDQMDRGVINWRNIIDWQYRILYLRELQDRKSQGSEYFYEFYTCMYESIVEFRLLKK